MPKTLTTLCLTAASLTIAPSALAAPHLSQSWKLHKVAQHGAVVIDSGTVRGALLGSGAIRLSATAHPQATVSLTFRERLAHGSITGRARLSYRFDSARNEVLYTGTGQITGGTGRYAHLRQAIKLTGAGFPNATERISISTA